MFLASRFMHFRAFLFLFILSDSPCVALLGVEISDKNNDVKAKRERNYWVSRILLLDINLFYELINEETQGL